MNRRCLAWVLVAFGLVLAMPSAAFAMDLSGGNNGGDPDGGAVDQGENIYSWVGRHGDDSPGLGTGGDPCNYEQMDYTDFQFRIGGLVGSNFDPALVTTPETATDGQFDFEWVIYSCPGVNGFFPITGWFQLGDPPPADGMLEHASRILTIDPPVPDFSPDATIPQLIGLETWLWLDPAQAATQFATACIPQNGPSYACVYVRAQFVDVDFDMGDGSPLINCGGIGVAYDLSRSYEAQANEPHCAHVYTDAPDSGTYEAVAASIWDVDWWCLYDENPGDAVIALTGPCGGGSLGFTARTGTPVALEIREIQAEATSSG